MIYEQSIYARIDIPTGWGIVSNTRESRAPCHDGAGVGSATSAHVEESGVRGFLSFSFFPLCLVEVSLLTFSLWVPVDMRRSMLEGEGWIGQMVLHQGRVWELFLSYLVFRYGWVLFGASVRIGGGLCWSNRVVQWLQNLIMQHVDHSAGDLIHLLQGLLRFDPINRLTAREALRHPFFSGDKFRRWAWVCFVSVNCIKHFEFQIHTDGNWKLYH